jgi:hypothetical protein
MLHREVMKIVSECRFPDYHLTAVDVGGISFIRASYREADTVTGEMERQQTRQWVVETCANRDEVVATCFKCVLTSMEHRAREWFTYRNAPIYQPHQSVEQLLAITPARSTP